MNAGRKKFDDRKKNDQDKPDLKALVGSRHGNKGERRHGQLISVNGVAALSTQP